MYVCLCVYAREPMLHAAIVVYVRMRADCMRICWRKSQLVTERIRSIMDVLLLLIDALNLTVCLCLCGCI